MNLSTTEQHILKELGMYITKEGEIALTSNMLDTEKLAYAGLGIYITDDNHVYEKIGEELVEVTSDELEAERRFIQNNTRQ